MSWKVIVHRQVEKHFHRLPKAVQESLLVLIRDLERDGPIRGNWPNYSKLGRNRHHCHIKKGKPTYVAIWEIRENEIKLIEVIYVGTHEKAIY